VSTALYNTLSAAIANAHAVDVTAHNVANASTTGFRPSGSPSVRSWGTRPPASPRPRPSPTAAGAR
jgi:flagellar basal body rod protein FlgF